MAAIAGREEIMRVFDPASIEEGTFVMGVGTLSGNPIAATAGLATLKVLKREGSIEKIWATGNRLKSEFTRLLKEKEIPGVVVGEAPCFDVYFGVEEVNDYRDSLKANNEMMDRFNHHMLESGVLKGGQKYYISLAHSAEDVDKTIEAMDYALDQARTSGRSIAPCQWCPETVNDRRHPSEPINAAVRFHDARELPWATDAKRYRVMPSVIEGR